MSSGILIFIGAAFVLSYTYLVYLLILFLGGQKSQSGNRAFSDLPTVSVIIPFHNEKRWVRQKLENTLQLKYPADAIADYCSVRRIERWD